MIKNVLTMGLWLFLCASCKTVDLEKLYRQNEQKVHPKEDVVEQAVDFEQTLVYVEKPVYYPEEKPVEEKKKSAEEITKEAQKASLQIPQRYTNGVITYDYKETFVYEIHCQPYRVTDIALEGGEIVLEVPFLSETEVWEVGAGVSKKEGKDVQHFFVKPSRKALTTTMTVITDKRMYHLLLKSFGDYYMPIVSWRYTVGLPNTYIAGIKNADGIKTVQTESGLLSADFFSFDYKMTYLKKVSWLPKKVYDDGAKTYIVVSEQALHTKLPALYNKGNELVNYRVDKNVLIIDMLIEKATLKLGNDTVTISKKRARDTV